MIEIRNLTKTFNGRKVLSDINLKFPRTGLVVINGPSGCGKTTLLNIISSLLDFEGEVIFDGLSYKKMSEIELDNLRNKKIGFVFQDFKLFEFESVKNNISLAVELSSDDSKIRKDKNIKDILNTVGLSHKEREIVNNLSGGEKQRVGIARAIANNPKVLLADEPTGNLDEANSIKIMELLAKLSTSSLVIVVSHDLSLSRKYADEVIELKDGKVISHKYYSKNKKEERIPVIKLRYKDKKLNLPFKFLLSHTLNSIKRRRWRTLLITFVTSLGLIGVGLASTLKEIISSNLLTSYSSILDSDRIVISNKKDNIEKDYVTAASLQEVTTLVNENEFIDDYGIYYWNADSLFKDENFLSIDIDGIKRPIGEYNSRLINEFNNIENYKGDVYPNRVSELSDDEVILSMPMLIISEFCYQLHISRTIDSFSTYLENHEVNILFAFSKYSWEYSIEVPLKLRGFILSEKMEIYHSNKYWNEYIFEDKCQLPITKNINSNSEHPWDIKKCYYLTFIDSRDEFLARSRFIDSDLDYEILDNKYYKTLFKGVDTVNCNRLAVIHRTNLDNIYSYIPKYCQKISKYIGEITYGTDNGYSIYEESLLMGFSRVTYLGKDKEYIKDISEEMSYVKYEDAFNISTPENILEGHFSKSQLNGFIFEPHYSLIAGRNPVNYQEIVISESLRNRLGLTNPLNSIIYLSYPVKESLLPNGYLSREYVTVDLKIVGISNSGKTAISHYESWSILFFKTMIGVSTFELRINNFALKINDGYENESIDKITRAFPFLEGVAPLNEVKSSVNQICDYIEAIMLIVSITSIIIASLILFLCNHLHYLEIKRDVGLVRCLGVKKSESKKFIYFHSFIMTGLSLLTSSLELVFVSFVLSKVMADTLLIESTFIFNPLSLVFMSAVAILISLLSSIFISRDISKLDALSCLK